MGSVLINPHPHISEFIQDEMDARGWTRDRVALRMGGDFGINKLALDMLMEIHDVNVILGQQANDLSRAFGVSAQYFHNIHNGWLADQAKIANDNPTCH